MKRKLCSRKTLKPRRDACERRERLRDHRPTAESYTMSRDYMTRTEDQREKKKGGGKQVMYKCALLKPRAKRVVHGSENSDCYVRRCPTRHFLLLPDAPILTMTATETMSATECSVIYHFLSRRASGLRQPGEGVPENEINVHVKWTQPSQRNRKGNTSMKLSPGT